MRQYTLELTDNPDIIVIDGVNHLSLKEYSRRTGYWPTQISNFLNGKKVARPLSCVRIGGRPFIPENEFPEK